MIVLSIIVQQNYTKYARLSVRTNGFYIMLEKYFTRLNKIDTTIDNDCKTKPQKVAPMRLRCLFFRNYLIVNACIIN